MFAPNLSTVYTRAFPERVLDEQCPHERAIAAADKAAHAAMVAIRAIQPFDERVVMCLISAIQGKLQASGWSHREHCVDADERLTDVWQELENAAEAMERES